MNSIFSILPFARYTIDTPSPVAIDGFVVVLYTCPLPPVAINVIFDKIFSTWFVLRFRTYTPITFYIWCCFGYQVTKMMLRDDINNKTMLDEFNILLFAHGIKQSPFHFPACNILMM